MNILGVVRDGGTALSATLSRIQSLRERLEDSRVIIATNDNSDGSDQVLASYAASYENVEILILEGLAARYDERVERIAAARNAVLKYLFACGKQFPFTMVLDMDGPNTELDADQVLRALSRETPNWDAVFANSHPVYYDLYALRREGWCAADPWRELVGLTPPRMLRSVWFRRMKRKIIYSRQYHIPTDVPLIEVESAFGGLGIYRTDALRNAEYAAHDASGMITCEHVMLHQLLREQGKRLFIDPGLLSVAQIEHTGPGSGRRIPEHLQR